MKKMVLGLMVVAGLLATSTVVANAADTDSKSVVSTGDVTFLNGNLSLSVDDTHLSFEKKPISADTTPLKASSSPTVTVNDFRGKPAGWSLTVAQDKQFSTADGSVLNNAKLSVVSTKISGDSGITTTTAPLNPGTTTSGTTTNGNISSMVASASAGVGNGVSQFSFKSSTLNVQSTNRLAQEYTTTLTWNLSDAPSN